MEVIQKVRNGNTKGNSYWMNRENIICYVLVVDLYICVHILFKIVAALILCQATLEDIYFLTYIVYLFTIVLDIQSNYIFYVAFG